MTFADDAGWFARCIYPFLDTESAAALAEINKPTNQALSSIPERKTALEIARQRAPVLQKRLLLTHLLALFHSWLPLILSLLLLTTTISTALKMDALVGFESVARGWLLFPAFLAIALADLGLYTAFIAHKHTIAAPGRDAGNWTAVWVSLPSTLKQHCTSSLFRYLVLCINAVPVVLVVNCIWPDNQVTQFPTVTLIGNLFIWSLHNFTATTEPVHTLLQASFCCVSAVVLAFASRFDAHATNEESVEAMMRTAGFFKTHFVVVSSLGSLLLLAGWRGIPKVLHKVALLGALGASVGRQGSLLQQFIWEHGHHQLVSSGFSVLAPALAIQVRAFVATCSHFRLSPISVLRCRCGLHLCAQTAQRCEPASAHGSVACTSRRAHPACASSCRPVSSAMGVGGGAQPLGNGRWASSSSRESSRHGPDCIRYPRQRCPSAYRRARRPPCSRRPCATG